uniref:Retrotransposon protein, putative, unclassified n=1 Tax=Ananas comosus var. bracteatus TaxID=296719 RepID=A0A6V7PF18_ANACO|nr:unnamed protein product [Ananas comosus var. bracteatus]
MQAEARHHWEEEKGMRSNVRKWPEIQPSFRPMKNDHKAGGSAPVLWLKSKIERLTPVEPTKKVTRKALQEKIAALEMIIKRDRLESTEFEKQVYAGEELSVAQLQLEDVKVADAVVFEKPSALQTRFVRPLFIKSLIEERPMGRVMIDGGAMVNVMPTSFFKKLGKGKNELKPTDMTTIDFTGNGQQARGVLTTELTVGSKTLRTAFFVVDADSHYNLLLGRDWIQANKCVLSTLHGKLFQWVGNRVEEIMAEGWPQMIDINVEYIGYINWANIDQDQISFMRVTKEGVQLVLLKDAEA